MPSGHTARLNFTGTPARVFRIWLPYAAPESEVVFVINYMGTPNRRFVWTEAAGRVVPLSAPPKIGDGTGASGAAGLPCLLHHTRPLDGPPVRGCA